MDATWNPTSAASDAREEELDDDLLEAAACPACAGGERPLKTMTETTISAMVPEKRSRGGRRLDLSLADSRTSSMADSTCCTLR
jgi:hypothetical protein